MRTDVKVGELNDAEAVKVRRQVRKLDDDFAHHDRARTEISNGDEDAEGDGDDRRAEPSRRER